MKKTISLGTAAMLSLMTIAGGVTAATAAGGTTLTSLSFESNAGTSSGTMAQTVTRIVNGDAATGTSIVDGCVINYADGIETSRNDLAAVSWDSATGNPSLFNFSNSTTAPITYLVEVYNVDCATITGSDIPVTGSYDVLPDATYSFDGSKSYTAGVDVGTDPVVFTENGSFNFDNGGTIALASGETMPAGLTEVTGFDAIGNFPTLDITGLPTSAGSFPVVFTVADTYGNTANATLTINVTAAPVAPAVSASPVSVSGVLGTEMTDVITLSTTGDWDFSTLPTVDVTGLPDGVTATPNFSGNTPTDVTLSGMPTSTGSGSMMITVTDNFGGTANTSVSWSVTSAPVPAALSVTPETLNGTVGNPVNGSFTISTSGDWDFSAGSIVDVVGLPAGLSETVNKSGNTPVSLTVSGTPTTVESGTFSVTVSDTVGNTQTANITFDIAAAPVVPVFEVEGQVNFMQGIENSTTVSFINDVNFDWTNGGTVDVVGLPTGLTFTVVDEGVADTVPSVVIEGLATDVGEYDISYILTDFATPTANEASVDDVAVVEPGVTSSTVTLNTPVGATVYGVPVAYVGSGLLVGSEWTLTLASTPVLLASGVVGLGGAVDGAVQMPTSGLAAGWHTLTLAGEAFDGSAYSKVLYFEIDASGNLIKTSDTKPADVTPAKDDALAKTGFVADGFVAAMVALLVAGAALLFGARRRNVETASN